MRRIARVEVPAWGNHVKLGYARAPGTLRIGNVDLGAVTALVTLDAPERSDIDRYPFRLSGVLGLRALQGRTIHLDLARGRFGIEA